MATKQSSLNHQVNDQGSLVDVNAAFQKILNDRKERMAKMLRLRTLRLEHERQMDSNNTPWQTSV